MILIAILKQYICVLQMVTQIAVCAKFSWFFLFFFLVQIKIEWHLIDINLIAKCHSF